MSGLAGRLREFDFFPFQYPSSHCFLISNFSISSREESAMLATSIGTMKACVDDDTKTSLNVAMPSCFYEF